MRHLRQVSFAPLGFGLTPWVKRLLIANTVTFLVTLVDQDFFFRWLAFSPSDSLFRPWGIVTYMFLHGDIWHLLFNMLVLFFFGPPLEGRWGGKDFVVYYFVCGLGGVALSFLFAPYWIVGASAAIYGIMLAFAMAWPDAPIYVWGIFPVKARWLVAFLFVVSVLGAVGAAGDGVAHFAHLGGLLTGFLYLKRDWRPRPGVSRVGSGRPAARVVTLPREERKGASAGAAPPERQGRGRGEEALLDEVDRILDKISAHGMASLTPEERRLLDEVSRRHRAN